MKKFFCLISVTSAFAMAVSAAATSDKLTPSQEIDSLIGKGYKTHKIKPNDPAPDAVLVRRLYLDIVGRIPTKAETEAFLSSKDPGKAGKLISELIESEGFVNHWFNYWADVLRLNRTDGSQIPHSLSAH